MATVSNTRQIQCKGQAPAPVLGPSVAEKSIKEHNKDAQLKDPKEIPSKTEKVYNKISLRVPSQEKKAVYEPSSGKEAVPKLETQLPQELLLRLQEQYNAEPLPRSTTHFPGTTALLPVMKDMGDGGANLGDTAGSYGATKLGILNNSNEEICVKGLCIKNYNGDTEAIFKEIDDLRAMHHSNIKHCACTSDPSWRIYYNDEFVYYMQTTIQSSTIQLSAEYDKAVTAVNKSKDLYHLIKRDYECKFMPLALAVAFSYELLIRLARLHNNHRSNDGVQCCSYAHCDISLENLLQCETVLRNMIRLYRVCLIDFGKAVRLDVSNMSKESRDAIRRDIVSTGVILSKLLSRTVQAQAYFSNVYRKEAGNREGYIYPCNCWECIFCYSNRLLSYDNSILNDEKLYNYFDYTDRSCDLTTCETLLQDSIWDRELCGGFSDVKNHLPHVICYNPEPKPNEPYVKLEET